MKLRNAIAIIIFILTGIIFLFSTPAVDIQAFGKNIKFDGLNLKTITNDKYKGEMEFNNGLDVRGGKKYTFNLDLTEIEETKREDYVSAIVERFADRLELYGFAQYDLKWTTTNTNTAEIELTMSKKSESDFAAIQLLGSKGEISFWTQDPDYDPEAENTESFSFLSGMKQADIKIDEVKSIESLYTNKANGYGFKIKFKKESENKLFLMSQLESSRGTMLVIDGQATGFRTYQIENLTNQGGSGEPVMYLSSLFGTSFAINDTLPAIFQTGTMSAQLDLLSEEDVTPLLGEDFESNIKFALFVCLSIISFALIFKYRVLGIYQIGLMAVFLIWLLALLKISGAYLDLPVIFGSVLGLIICLIINIDMIKDLNTSALTDKNKFSVQITKLIEKNKYTQKTYRNYILVVMAVSMVVSYVPFVEVSSFATGLGTASVIMLFMVYLSTNFILPQFLIWQKKYEDRYKSTEN